MFPRRDPRRDRQVSLLDDERGVSPVVGTILVLAISTVGIFAVMYWGVPAMTEVQDRTAFDAVLQQYAAADGVIENVVRGGSPDKAATVQMSLPGGKLEWNDGSRFLIELYFKHSLPLTSVDFVFDGWQDKDASIKVRNVGDDLTTATVSILNWRGATFERAILTAGAWDGDDAGGDGGSEGREYEFVFPIEIRELVLSFQIEDQGVLLYEAWILDIGQLNWEFSTSLNVLEMVEENAATLTNQSGTFWVHDRPLVHSETFDAPNDDEFQRFTMYLAQLVRNTNIGSPGVEGKGTYRVLFALEDNYLRDANVDLLRFDIRVHGAWREAWLAYFDETAGLDRTADGRGVTYVADDPARPVRFALFHARVWTTIMPFNTLVDEDVIAGSYNTPPPDPLPSLDLPRPDNPMQCQPGGGPCHLR